MPFWPKVCVCSRQSLKGFSLVARKPLSKKTFSLDREGFSLENWMCHNSSESRMIELRHLFKEVILSALIISGTTKLTAKCMHTSPWDYSVPKSLCTAPHSWMRFSFCRQTICRVNSSFCETSRWWKCSAGLALSGHFEINRKMAAAKASLWWDVHTMLMVSANGP